MDMKISSVKRFFVMGLLFFLSACVTGGEAVRVKTVSKSAMEILDKEERDRLAELKQAEQGDKEPNGIKTVIKGTPNYSVDEYLKQFPAGAGSATQDYRVGGYDVLTVTVYEEQDLSRKDLAVSADGYISFPLIGRVLVLNLTPSEIEALIARKLTEGQYVMDAHVSVTVTDYRSKQFMVLGSVKTPGAYPLKAKERVLDALSKAGGVDAELAGRQAVVIRTFDADTPKEKKIVIRLDLPGLLKGGDQTANLALADKDLLYIPKSENFYILGQVKTPGSYPYLEKEVSLVEAISKAGGFTQIAARNRTRIIRVEEGVEKIIEVRVDEITEAGKKGKDVTIQPGDVIVVPESFF